MDGDIPLFIESKVLSSGSLLGAPSEFRRHKELATSRTIHEHLKQALETEA